MRVSFAISLLFCLSLSGGCGSTIHDTKGQGPVDPGLYRAAIMENQQRLAGEDHRLTPLYTTPWQAIGVAYDKTIGAPMEKLSEYMMHDTPIIARNKMDSPTSSPDDRISGTLRLVGFQYARSGAAERVDYQLKANDPDYVVRAAGLRALNRSRAQGYTSLFLKALEDDEVLVRLEAADALGNIPDPAATSALEIALARDPNTDVRIACAEALRNYKTLEVAKTLVERLNDKNFGVAWQSRQSLALLTAQDFRYDENAWLTYISHANDLK